MISMASPELTAAEVDAVLSVLRTKILSIGPHVQAFERDIARYSGVAHAAAMSSGTAGLHLAVIAAGVQDGDLVITTPFSFVASANVMLYERAIPIFVDVDPKTGNIDPRLMAECADEFALKGTAAAVRLPRKLPPGRLGRLKALLPVHTFGQPADMYPILEIAQRHDLRVVEDACEAIGAEHKGRKAGTFGDAGVFAFYPNKQMTTGEGGMIVTDRGDWDAIFRSLRNQGRDVFDVWLNHDRLGYNYRLEEMSAALGCVQLSRIEELLANRDRVADWYNERLAGLEGVEIPYIAPSTTRMSWFVYVIRTAPGIDRTAVMKGLGERGVPSRPYFTPIHLQPFYVKKFGYREGDFPVTEDLGRRSLALPFSSVMLESQVEYVCEQVREVVESLGRRNGRQNGTLRGVHPTTVHA